jgi:hypothetical protein
LKNKHADIFSVLILPLQAALNIRRMTLGFSC